MNAYRALLITLVAAMALIAVACGGDDKDGIQVQSGLGALPPASGSSGSSAGSGSASSASGSSTVARSDIAVAPDASRSSLPSSSLSSSFPMPYLQGSSTDGLSVQGYGIASTTADRAVVYFYLSSGYGEPKPLIECAPSQSSACPTSPTPPVPITRDMLQPLIDAIKGQGVADADIEITLQPYGTIYGAASIAVLLRDVNKTDAVIDAVRNAASRRTEYQLNSINAAYTLSDCTALEREAVIAATRDARKRASALADVLDVTIGKITGAYQQSYAGYGPYGCGQDNFRIMEVANYAMPFGQQQDRKVQISAAVALTFEIR